MEPKRDQSAESLSDAGSARAKEFESTHWSMVVQAQDGSASQAHAALGTLCQTYYYPIYAYIRRRAASVVEAEDLTQGFFTSLLERGLGGGVVEGAKGKFRHYLLACCQHFLANERKHARTLKQGGGKTRVSLDLAAADRRYLLEPADSLTAEKLFDRAWALSLLERCLGQLRAEYAGQGKRALFDELKGRLTNPSSLAAGAAAQRLGMSEAAVRKAGQRLRQDYAEMLRREILATVERRAEVEDEIRELFAVLQG